MLYSFSFLCNLTLNSFFLVSSKLQFLSPDKIVEFMVKPRHAWKYINLLVVHMVFPTK